MTATLFQKVSENAVQSLGGFFVHVVVDDVGVNVERRTRLLVSHDVGDNPRVLPLFQQHGCERVPKGIQGNPLTLQALRLDEPVEQTAET